MKPWKKEEGDTGLLDMLPLLEAVVRTQVPDVRAVVASYQGEDDVAAAYRRRLAAAAESQRSQKAARTAGGFLGAFAGR